MPARAAAALLPPAAAPPVPAAAPPNRPSPPSPLLHSLRQASARIVVAYRTELYRAAIIHNVEHGSCCLEVGSHTGSTTALLHKRCGGRAVGVDNVPLMVQGQCCIYNAGCCW